MKYVDFKKFTDENGAQPIYVFEGEEQFFHEKGAELLKSRFLRDATLDFVAFDGANVKGDKINDVISAVNCFPFLSPKRIVKVSEFYPTEKEYESYLKGFFTNPAPTGILMIFNSAKQKNAVAFQKKPNVTYVDCARSDVETMKRWVYATAKREGIFVDGITSGKIVSYCVGDMARVAKETEKLLAYLKAKGESKMTDEVVDEIVYPDSDVKFYELTNALLASNHTSVSKLCKELLSKGYDELSLLSSLTYAFKSVYEALITGGSDEEIASLLSIRDFALRRQREQGRKYGKEEVFKAYERLYDAVAKVKSGEWTAKSAYDLVFEQFFLQKRL